MQTLGRGARAIRDSLSSKANAEGCVWWSQKRIADETGYKSVRQIGRLIEELEQAGELSVTRRGSKSALYTIRQNVRTDTTKCPNVSIKLNLKQEKLASLPFPVEIFVAECDRLRVGVAECVWLPDLVRLFSEARCSPETAAEIYTAFVHSSRERVSRAKDPKAYTLGAIRSELDAWRERKPAGRAATA